MLFKIIVFISTFFIVKKVIIKLLEFDIKKNFHKFKIE